MPQSLWSNFPTMWPQARSWGSGPFPSAFLAGLHREQEGGGQSPSSARAALWGERPVPTFRQPAGRRVCALQGCCGCCASHSEPWDSCCPRCPWLSRCVCCVCWGHEHWGPQSTLLLILPESFCQWPGTWSDLWNIPYSLQNEKLLRVP